MESFEKVLVVNAEARVRHEVGRLNMLVNELVEIYTINRSFIEILWHILISNPNKKEFDYFHKHFIWIWILNDLDSQLNGKFSIEWEKFSTI